jgi:hypothetical protein
MMQFACHPKKTAKPKGFSHMLYTVFYKAEPLLQHPWVKTPHPAQVRKRLRIWRQSA